MERIWGAPAAISQWLKSQWKDRILGRKKLKKAFLLKINMGIKFSLIRIINMEGDKQRQQMNWVNRLLFSQLIIFPKEETLNFETWWKKDKKCFWQNLKTIIFLLIRHMSKIDLDRKEIRVQTIRFITPIIFKEIIFYPSLMYSVVMQTSHWTWITKILLRSTNKYSIKLKNTHQNKTIPLMKSIW